MARSLAVVAEEELRWGEVALRGGGVVWHWGQRRWH